jgi:hypothetical protein
MILMPAIGGSRSSLAAGIFHACGAWTGITREAQRHKANYDSYENFFIITALNGLREGMATTKQVDFIKKLVAAEIPYYGVPVILKFHYRYLKQMKLALPDSMIYGVERRKHKDPTRMADYRRVMNRQKIEMIDTDKLIQKDFSQIERIIAHCGLQWDRDAVEGIYL